MSLDVGFLQVNFLFPQDLFICVPAILLIDVRDNLFFGIWKKLNFGGAPKSLQMVIAAMKLKDAYSLEGKLRPT